MWSLQHFQGHCFFLEKCCWIDYIGEPDQEVLVKVNFLYHFHYWYLERKSLLPWWKRRSLYLFVFQKKKCYCNKRDSTMDHLSLGDVCINVIKFITFSMNPRLTSITLSCRVFIIDFYIANFSGVSYIINIYRNAHQY